MSNLPESSPGTIHFPLGLILWGFAFCNFLTPPIMDSMGPSEEAAFLIGITIGLMAGQCGLLAIWGVLGPLGAPLRLAITLAVGVFLMAALGLGGIIVDSPGDDLDKMLAIVLFLPLILLAAQLPLWGFRLVTGGRIVPVGARSLQSPTSRGQFGIRHLMGGTLVVAVALSLARSGLHVFGADGAEGWIPILIICLYLAVGSTFVTLPCVWAGMIARNKGIATVIVAVYALLMSLLAVVVTGLFNRGRIPGEVVLMLFLMHATPVAAILGTLHLARVCGYTFVGRRRPHAGRDSDCPFAVQDAPPENLQSGESASSDADEPPNSAEPCA